MNTLLCPRRLFDTVLRELADDRRRPLFLRVGGQRNPTETTWLAQGIVRDPSPGIGGEQDRLFRIASRSDPIDGSIPWEPMGETGPAVVGQLVVGDGPSRGRLWGVVYSRPGPVPLDRLVLVGAGMHTLAIHRRADALRETEPAGAWADAVPARWSRTIGAIGDRAVWERLVGLPMAVVGCGRTGSIVAATLARLGVRRLVLIDPDAIDLDGHNLGEMDAVTDDDRGRSKVDAIADYLRSTLADLPLLVTPIAAPFTERAAFTAALSCPIWVSCVDNDAGRLAVAIGATLYQKVLVDIGTGVFLAEDAADGREGRTAVRRAAGPATAGDSSRRLPVRTMGADVRLILPGDGCLLCRGSLTNFARAVDELVTPPARPAAPADWRRERAGSARTLNQLAAAIGVQLVADLVAERVQTTTWAHVAVDGSGRLAVEYPTPARPAGQPPCTLCARAGLGDAGLGLSESHDIDR